MTAPIRTEAESGTGAPIVAAAVAELEKGPGDLSYMDFHSMTYMAVRQLFCTLMRDVLSPQWLTGP